MAKITIVTGGLLLDETLGVVDSPTFIVEVTTHLGTSSNIKELHTSIIITKKIMIIVRLLKVAQALEAKSGENPLSLKTTTKIRIFHNRTIQLLFEVKSSLYISRDEANVHRTVYLLSNSHRKMRLLTKIKEQGW